MFSPIRPCRCQVEIVARVIFYSYPEISVKYWGKHSRVVPHPKCFKLYHIGLWWWTRAKSIRYLHVFYVCRINPRGFGPAVVLKPFVVQPRDKARIVSWRFWGQLQELNSDTLKAFRAKRRRRSGTKRCDSPLITGVYTTMPARLGSDTVLSRMRPPMLRTAT